MFNSDQQEKQKETSSQETSPESAYQTAEKDPREEEALCTDGDVGSIPLIGTVFASSKENEKRATVNPTRIEKAIETQAVAAPVAAPVEVAAPAPVAAAPEYRAF